MSHPDFGDLHRYPLDLDLLPPGWAVTTPESVCSIIEPGFASGEHNAEGVGIPHLRPMNVSRDGRIDLSELKFVDPARDSRRLSRGDVLFNNTNSPVLVGKTCAIEIDTGLAFSNHMTRLRPVAGIETSFLANQLHYLWMSGFFLHRCVKHVNQASIASSVLADRIPILIAPTKEQKRIVEFLESLVSRLDAAVTALERARANLKRHRASMLKAAVEGRLVPTEAELARKEGRDFEQASVLLKRILVERRHRWEESEIARMKASGKPPKDDRWKSKYKEPVAPDTSALPQLPEGWCWTSVDQLGEVSGGLTKNPAREKLTTRLPYLRVANVYANELRLDEILDIGVETSELQRVKLQPGDLLVVEGNGSPDRIGRVALWDGSIDPCVHQNHLIKVRLGDETISQWTLSWLLSPVGHSLISSAASSTSGLHTLSISKVGRLPVPFAPLREQERAISELERCESVTTAAMQTVARSDQRAARLRQAILKWAFEGKLVDQDPNDEPAPVLLERIRAERSAALPPRKSRKAIAHHAEAAK